MTIQKATNITWHEGALNKKDREKLLDQKGVVIWFTSCVIWPSCPAT